MRPWWMVFLLAGCGHDGPEVPDPAAMLLARLDTDGSGDLVSSELAAVHPDKVLHELDKDKDGVISLEELRADLDETPPLLGRWRNIYLLVLGSQVVVALVFWLIGAAYP